MIDLKSSAKHLSTLKTGDKVLLDGQIFTFERMPGGICLTSDDSNVNNYTSQTLNESSYSSMIRHVRVNGLALLTISELSEALTNGIYKIDEFHD